MAYFTSGERRGLIVLACFLVALAVILAGRDLRWRSAEASGDAEADETTVKADDSLGLPLCVESADDSLKRGAGTAASESAGDSLELARKASPDSRRVSEVSAKASRKTKRKSSGKARKSAPLPAPRQPLDQPVN